MGQKATSKSLISEFIGTFLLVFAVGCNTVSTASGTWAALSIASTLMVSIYALGAVSGAMFNPAVALAYFLSGEDKEYTATDMLSYMGVQLLGGAAAGLSSLALHGEAMQLKPGDGFSMYHAGVIEFLYTFMLCFVVLRAACVTPQGAGECFGLAIGFVIVAGGYAGGFISCGALNPAVALGVDLGSAGQGVFYCLPYAAVELLAGACAAMASKFFTARNGPAEATTVEKAASEFLGTFFLVLTVGLNVTGGSPAGALSIGASLMCMIYALNAVSGANFNPAVTFTLALLGEMKGADIGIYMASQVAGGLVAAFTYVHLVGKAAALAPGPGHTMVSVFAAEFVSTFVLCFVVVGCAVAAGYKHISGLAIGFCIVAMGNAIGAVSGGSLNPAVSIALDVSAMSKGLSFGNCALYSVYEFLGAGAAAGAFMFCHAKAKGGLLGEKQRLLK